MLQNIENKHGGDIYHNDVLYDFSANVNPYGTPEQVKQAIRDSAELVSNYPDPYAFALREKIAQIESKKHQITMNSNRIILSNGAAELIFTYVLAQKPKKALLIAPSFSEYEQALNSMDTCIEWFVLQEREQFKVTERILDAITEEYDLLILCNPNNPTGAIISNEIMNEILLKCRECQVSLLVDECFLEWTDLEQTSSLLPYLEENPNLFILRAFTKSYGMAGVRLGYGFTSNQQLLTKMSKCVQTWNVSTIALQAGLAALHCDAFFLKAKELVRQEREYLVTELNQLGLKVYEGVTNYIFFSGKKQLKEELLKSKILIRDCSNYPGLEQGYYRIAIRLPKENQALIKALQKVLT